MEDIKQAIINSGLSKDTVAKDLFPSHTHPLRTLERVLKGERELREAEIQRLGKTLSIKVEGKGWKGIVLSDGVSLQKGPYTAIFYPETGVCKVIKNEKKIYEVAMAPVFTPIQEFTKFLDDLIEGKLIT